MIGNKDDPCQNRQEFRALEIWRIADVIRTTELDITIKNQERFCSRNNNFLFYSLQVTKYNQVPLLRTIDEQ